MFPSIFLAIARYCCKYIFIPALMRHTLRGCATPACLRACVARALRCVARWDAWGTSLSGLLESLPVVAVASYHDIEVNPTTHEAFSHFRRRFRAPEAEPEERRSNDAPLPLAAQVCPRISSRVKGSGVGAGC